MSANYKQTCERVWGTGKQVFTHSFPVRDDYGFSEAKWEVYRVGSEWWLQGSYNDTNSFARFVGVPDLEAAETRVPSCDAPVPCPADSQCDSDSAKALFGCGLDEATYEHNAF